MLFYDEPSRFSYKEFSMILKNFISNRNAAVNFEILQSQNKILRATFA